MEDFVSTYGLSEITHLSDESGDIWSHFGVTSQPSWVFIDDDGSSEIVFGALGAEGLTERIDALAQS